MRFRSRQQSPPKPRTLMGQWLRASVVEDIETRRRLSRKLNGGADGWNDDEPAVVEAACELAVRQFFGSSYDVRAITKFVSEVRGRVQGTQTPINQLETEAVIRSGLGERDVDISDLKRLSLLNIRTIVFVQICINLALDEQAADQLIAEAEHVAFERGWNPPLATT